MRKPRILDCASALLLCLCYGGLAVGAVPPEIAGCAKCHGENGVSTRPQVPTIAGASAAYLDAQMAAYQKGQRPCPKLSDPQLSDTEMCQVAKKLTAAQISPISAFYAGQKPVAASQTIDAALAAKGKALQDVHCAECHSAGGSQPADDAGILAGQWKPYLQATLADYVAGKRAQPDAMKRQTAHLSPADVQALVEFYASEAVK